jgi:hypothetical protein
MFPATEVRLRYCPDGKHVSLRVADKDGDEMYWGIWPSLAEADVFARELCRLYKVPTVMYVPPAFFPNREA